MLQIVNFVLGFFLWKSYQWLTSKKNPIFNVVDDILYCTVKTLPLNVNFFGTKINLYEDLPCDVVLLFHVCLIL